MHRRFAALFLAAGLNSSAVFGQASQTTFDFHSGFWVNLHHTLYNQAAGNKAGRAPNLSALNATEATAWNAALDYYDRNLAGKDLLDFSMTRINTALAKAGNAASLKGAGVPEPLSQLLENAAPVYRAQWWAEHDRKNHAWIDGVTPLIAQYESALKPAFARAYDTPWPKGRIHVEMSYYTTGASGYTSIRPTLITISSGSLRNVGPAGLETVFHEAGHALVPKIRDEIGAADARRGRKPAYPDLWHAVMFYTTGELVKQQVPEVVPYAIKYGMWETTWPNLLPIMERDWKPFLDGKASLRESLDRVAADSE
jgi:hypothetical protein